MNFFRGRNVLITGGLGFIGSNLAIELHALGARVTVLDSMLPGSGAKISNLGAARREIDIRKNDVCDHAIVHQIVKQQQFIFCLAGQVSHVESMRNPLVDLDVNCRSIVSLLECCRETNPNVRLVIASTRQVYGRPEFLPVTERHPIQPTDVNGINKWAAERYAVLYSNIYGLSSICLRMTNTFGPRMDITNPNKGFIGVFIGRALRGEIIRVFGDGEQKRDFNYVSDVVDALILAAQVEGVSGQCFNLGYPEHFSLNQFLEFLADIVPIRAEHVHFPPERKPIDIGDCYSDFSMFHQQTGWNPKVGLREGLQRTIEYYKQHDELVRC